MKLYHCTEKKNLEPIFDKGLLRRGAFVFLSRRPESWYRKGMVLLEVETAGLTGRFTDDGKIDEILYWGDVPAKNLKPINILTTKRKQT